MWETCFVIFVAIRALGTRFHHNPSHGNRLSEPWEPNDIRALGTIIYTYICIYPRYDGRLEDGQEGGATESLAAPPRDLGRAERLSRLVDEGAQGIERGCGKTIRK